VGPGASTADRRGGTTAWAVEPTGWVQGRAVTRCDRTMLEAAARREGRVRLSAEWPSMAQTMYFLIKRRAFSPAPPYVTSHGFTTDSQRNAKQVEGTHVSRSEGDRGSGVTLAASRRVHRPRLALHAHGTQGGPSTRRACCVRLEPALWQAAIQELVEEGALQEVRVRVRVRARARVRG